MFATQAEAKRFFVEKIVAQAVAEGEPLSAVEKKLLGFSESARDLAAANGGVEHGGELSESRYEAKVSGLLKRSYKRDVASDPGARASYREAHSILVKGDHYLLVMIEQALGPPRSRWVLASGPLGVAVRLGLFLFFAIPGVISVLLAVGIGWTLVSNRPTSMRQVAELGPFLLFLGWGGMYLIRVWMREGLR